MTIVLRELLVPLLVAAALGYSAAWFRYKFGRKIVTERQLHELARQHSRGRPGGFEYSAPLGEAESAAAEQRADDHDRELRESVSELAARDEEIARLHHELQQVRAHDIDLVNGLQSRLAAAEIDYRQVVVEHARQASELDQHRERLGSASQEFLDLRATLHATEDRAEAVARQLQHADTYIVALESELSRRVPMLVQHP